LPEIRPPRRTIRNWGLTMHYVVCYDVTDDRRRAHVSEALLDFGVRVQESVFECILEPPLAEKMVTRLRSLIAGEVDKINIYQLCGACAERSIGIGQAEVARDRPFYVV